jgi:hypothetical protein
MTGLVVFLDIIQTHQTNDENNRKSYVMLSGPSTAASRAPTTRGLVMPQLLTAKRRAEIPAGTEKSAGSLRPQLDPPRPSHNVTFTVYGATQDVTSHALDELRQMVARAYREVTVEREECDALHYLDQLYHRLLRAEVIFQKKLQQWSCDLAIATYGKKTNESLHPIGS